MMYLANRIHPESELMPDYLNDLFQGQFSVLALLFSKHSQDRNLFLVLLHSGGWGGRRSSPPSFSHSLPPFFITSPTAFESVSFHLFCNVNNATRASEKIIVFLLCGNGRGSRKLPYFINLPLVTVTCNLSSCHLEILSIIQTPHFFVYLFIFPH